jgi:hypothetical protein
VGLAGPLVTGQRNRPELPARTFAGGVNARQIGATSAASGHPTEGLLAQGVETAKGFLAEVELLLLPGIRSARSVHGLPSKQISSQPGTGADGPER